MFNRKGEVTRTRRVNGPIIIVVLSFIAWAIMCGVLAVRIMRALDARHEHTHTAECWDD